VNDKFPNPADAVSNLCGTKSLGTNSSDRVQSNRWFHLAAGHNIANNADCLSYRAQSSVQINSPVAGQEYVVLDGLAIG
jgi:hypothetical protein